MDKFVSICKKELNSISRNPTNQFVLHINRKYVCCMNAFGYISIDIDDDVYGSCQYMFTQKEYDEYFYSTNELRLKKLKKLNGKNK